MNVLFGLMLGVAMLAPGDHRIEIAYGGLQRSYIVRVPPGAPAPRPVVVSLHGGGGIRSWRGI